MERSLRHRTIMQAVGGRQTVTVPDLAHLTGASAVTVRRDLAELESIGALTRTHGGARRAAKRGSPMPFSVRVGQDLEVKQRLGEAAAALVEDHHSIIVDNGTACLAVAQELAGRPVTALALSLHAAAALASVPGAYVTVPGGPVEADTLAMTGAGAVEAIDGVRVDLVFLGTCSASVVDGLTSISLDDAAAKRAALRSAAQAVLVTTSDKLRRSSTFRFGSASDLDHLVTTDDAPAEAIEVFREAGVEVHLVPARP